MWHHRQHEEIDSNFGENWDVQRVDWAVLIQWRGVWSISWTPQRTGHLAVYHMNVCMAVSHATVATPSPFHHAMQPSTKTMTITSLKIVFAMPMYLPTMRM